MRKLNCWEIKKCGRESEGFKADNRGVCPAAVDQSSDGINGGRNGGRICWSVAGTFCKEKVRGSFAQQTASCIICEVYERVRSEEDSESFILLKAGYPYNRSHK